jgi:2-dehydropantoate 2-reductase
MTSAGLSITTTPDIRDEIWSKLMGNAAFNPISALTRATLAAICADPATRSLAATVMQEAADIADKLGLRLRLSIEQRIQGAAEVGDHKTSMLQDVEAGRELEIDPLIGSFVEVGRITGTPVPATEMLHALVSQLNASIAKGMSA